MSVDGAHFLLLLHSFYTFNDACGALQTKHGWYNATSIRKAVYIVHVPDALHDEVSLWDSVQCCTIAHDGHYGHAVFIIGFGARTQSHFCASEQ